MFIAVSVKKGLIEIYYELSSEMLNIEMAEQDAQEEIDNQIFDPKLYVHDPRVEFELILKDGFYECSLCKHKLSKSNAAVEQLKATHLRKQAHQTGMKQK